MALPRLLMQALRTRRFVFSKRAQPSFYESAERMIAALQERHGVQPAGSQPAATRVLINAIHAKSGGGVTYLRSILPLLAARDDLHVEIVIQDDQTALLDDLPPEVPCHIVPAVGRMRTVLWQEHTTIPALARKLNADVIFSPANYGPLRGPPAVILLRNSLTVGRIETRLTKRLYWLALWLISRAAFRRCRQAIVVSDHARREFMQAFGVSDDPRTKTIPHGIAPLFSPPADDTARTRGALLAVSDIYVQKNLETLIRAVSILSTTHKTVTLEIAGRELDPGHASELRALCNRLGVADRVRFLGGLPRQRVAELYRTADVFVFPSLIETFGNPLVEAMASGLPVVCSDTSAMPEIAGEGALVVAPRDAHAMVAAIARLLDDRTLWVAQSQRGLARARHFSWQRTADETARVLQSAAKPH